MAERKTRFVILCKMDGCTADAALTGFTRQTKRLPASLRKSMTYDRGADPLMVCEQTTAGQGMACHLELARRLMIDIWFCDPHLYTRENFKLNRAATLAEWRQVSTA